MKRVWLLIVGIALMAGGGRELEAQRIDSLREGDRIRVHVPNLRSLREGRSGICTGTLESLGTHGLSMELIRAEGSVAVTYREMAKMELSLGRPRSQGAAFLIGAVCGGALGYLTGVGFGGLPALGAVAGIGGMVSLAFNREHWEEIPLPQASPSSRIMMSPLNPRPGSIPR